MLLSPTYFLETAGQQLRFALFFSINVGHWPGWKCGVWGTLGFPEGMMLVVRWIGAVRTGERGCRDEG